MGELEEGEEEGRGGGEECKRCHSCNFFSQFDMKYSLPRTYRRVAFQLVAMERTNQNVAFNGKDQSKCSIQ